MATPKSTQASQRSGQPASGPMIEPLAPGEARLMYRAICAFIPIETAETKELQTQDPEAAQKERAARTRKQMGYLRHAFHRYGPEGMGDITYTAIELDTGGMKPAGDPRGGSKWVPLTLAVPVLSHRNATYIVHASGGYKASMAREKHHDVWEDLNLPGKYDVIITDTPEEALLDGRFKQPGKKEIKFDEINFRKPTMDEKFLPALADAMISKLNADETEHPKGASILIGLDGQGQKLVDIILTKLPEAGLTVVESSIHHVGQGETPARLMFIRRASEPSLRE